MVFNTIILPRFIKRILVKVASYRGTMYSYLEKGVIRYCYHLSHWQ